MDDASLPRIQGYHAHVYFDAQTLDQARALCEEAAQRFPLKMGRMHERPVGPHPDWSCQMAFRPELFGELIPWLALKRDGLVVLVHPITGNDLLDHRERALWMGGAAAGPERPAGRPAAARSLSAVSPRSGSGSLRCLRACEFPR